LQHFRFAAHKPTIEWGHCFALLGARSGLPGERPLYYE